MAFNPTLPAPNSEMRSEEMRNQFNGLKDLIDDNIPASEKGAADGVASLDSNGLLTEQVDWSKVANKPSLVLATGFAGGQTINGGTASGENLTLVSTSHATKGKVTIPVSADAAMEFSLLGESSNPRLRIYDSNGFQTYYAARNIRMFQGEISLGKLGDGNINSGGGTIGGNVCLDWLNRQLLNGTWTAIAKTAATVPLVSQAIAGQSAPLLKCVDSASSEQFGIGATGQIRTNQTANATTPGSVVKKLPVFDASGNSLGYIPIYDAIT